MAPQNTFLDKPLKCLDLIFFMGKELQLEHKILCFFSGKIVI